MSVRIQDSAKAQKGADGYYHHVTGDLGIKVYRQPDDSMAQREYLLTCYAYDSTGASVEALGYSHVQVILGGKLVSRPGIYLRHIDGQNCRDFARDLGWAHNARFGKNEAEMWGYDSPDFAPVADRINSVCNTLQEQGFQCLDHLENFGNFMLDECGKVHAIDFSYEAENVQLLRKIGPQYFHKLAIGMPSAYVEYLFNMNSLEL